MHYEKNWNCVEDIRKQKYNEVQGKKKGYEGKYECDTVFIIDFLNAAIREVYQLYPQYINKKFNIENFLWCVMEQSDVNRKGYQIPINIIYTNKNNYIYNSADKIDISKLEGLGFNCELGEVSIYMAKVCNDYQTILNEVLKNALIEINYNINDTGKYTNIVFISDRNDIGDEIFINAQKSCKKLILGRLDNKRTTCYDACTWFDIEFTIMRLWGLIIKKDV